MRVGMIFECGPRGADEQVCTHLARRLNPSIQISTVTLSTKPQLISDCGEAARVLLDQGCDRVIVIWDLHPGHGKEPCRHYDSKEIFAALKRANITSPPAYLVCIEAMLEAWLLADGTALSSLLSRPTHAVNVKGERRPERIRDPKKRLISLFREHWGGRPYIDRQHSIMIAKVLDLAKVRRRCRTFDRFAGLVTDE